MIILILVTLLTTVFLELIWGSAKTVQGIEASNVAYYQSVGIIEEQLIDSTVSKKTPWNIANKTESFSQTGRKLEVSTGASTMPDLGKGKGNSPYDKEYNIISLGNPVQIVIPDWVNWSNVFFEFRVPAITISWSTTGTGVANTMTNSGLILWTLGYSWASLYASGETQIFRWLDINDPAKVIYWFNGTTNSGSPLSFNSFYADNTNNYLWTNGAKCANYACTLKLSMIRPVATSLTSGGTPDGRSLPFLEYRINFWVPVPSQFMVLDATAYAYWFQRTRTIRIPQVTTNTALDFAVLQ
jgi:hypothetical protein